eukprot:5881410-Pyramimonas_sp.AAC.1
MACRQPLSARAPRWLVGWLVGLQPRLADWLCWLVGLFAPQVGWLFGWPIAFVKAHRRISPRRQVLSVHVQAYEQTSIKP